MNPLEIERNSHSIVTVETVKFNCRYCSDWFVGTYDAARLGFEAHMKYAHDIGIPDRSWTRQYEETSSELP